MVLVLITYLISRRKNYLQEKRSICASTYVHKMFKIETSHGKNCILLSHWDFPFRLMTLNKRPFSFSVARFW